MTVTVRAHGSLRDRIPSGARLDDVHTVGEAITRLAIPPDLGLAIMVNGHIANWNTTLADGDLLQLVPALAGG
jgi:molybdopterin converting factor small subunit